MIKLKKHSIIFIIAVLVILVLVGAGCGKYSSPEKTLSFLIETMEEGSVDAYLECYTKESQEILNMLKLTTEGLRAGVSDYKNAKFKVTEKIGDMVVMTSEIAGNRVLVFKKEKGNWKVDITVLKRDTKRITDLMGTLRSGALEFYFADHASYPVLTDTSEDGEFLKVLIDDGYLAEMLLDPLHPEYFYEYEGTVDSYTLKCYCETEGGYCDMADGVKDHVFIYSYSLERAFDETADLKVYVNEEYSFEIKYPKEWRVMSQNYNPISGLYYQLFLTNNEQLTLALLDFPNRKALEDELVYTLAIWEKGDIAGHYQEDIHYELLGTINNYDFVSVDDYRNPGKEIFDQIFSTFKFIK